VIGDADRGSERTRVIAHPVRKPGATAV